MRDWIICSQNPFGANLAFNNIFSHLLLPYGISFRSVRSKFRMLPWINSKLLSMTINVTNYSQPAHQELLNKNAKASIPHLVMYCFDCYCYFTGSCTPNKLYMHIFVISGSKSISLDILFSF